ncbi:MAG: hypothetical protein JO159_00095 [Acidobacteria bacterium]|nr:hypothetical protein [Acidobacteriota bacterium]MBV9625316.1 hypothetical protein [Acidobacteriota bacterium]
MKSQWTAWSLMAATFLLLLEQGRLELVAVSAPLALAASYFVARRSGSGAA